MTNKELINWAGNYTYSTKLLSSPASIDELISYIRQHKKYKVLGTRHCFNHIADSTTEFLSLKNIPPEITIDRNLRTVTVSGGIRYGDLSAHLHGNGYALHNLASLPHISVAGACATATHGSGSNNGNLATAVAAIEFITSDGNIVTLSREKNEEQFSGAIVHLGALGIVTRMTLDIEPAYEVRQDVYENLPMHQLQEHFDEIMSAGYSVSLFTDWQKRNIGEVWIKSKMGLKNPVTEPTDFFGAKPATKNLHPIPGISAENCTEQMGVAGPWHERLPHFKMGFTPSSGEELQSEYFVPRQYAYDAIAAVEQLHQKITPHLLISEIRTIDADNLWMSPCYQQPCVAIHFTWKQNWPAVSSLLPQIEEQLYAFHARPHWGKLFTASPDKIRELYPKMTDFQQLVKQFDPEGTFANEYLIRNIGN
jgi:xylitol oxidase